jgi:hypothetical protein
LIPGRRPPADGGDSRRARTRRGFVQALLVAIGAVAVVGMTWVVGRGRPSAGRDPEYTPPAFPPPQTDSTAMPDAESG